MQFGGTAFFSIFPLLLRYFLLFSSIPTPPSPSSSYSPSPYSSFLPSSTPLLRTPPPLSPSPSLPSLLLPSLLPSEQTKRILKILILGILMYIFIIQLIGFLVLGRFSFFLSFFLGLHFLHFHYLLPFSALPFFFSHFHSLLATFLALPPPKILSKRRE